MTEYELSKLADMQDEDAVDMADFDLSELLPEEEASPTTFKKKYLAYYDDIKTTPYDDW